MAGKCFSKIENNTRNHQEEMKKYNQMVYGDNTNKIYSPTSTPQIIPSAASIQKVNPMQNIYDGITIFYEDLDKFGLVKRDGQITFSLDVLDILDKTGYDILIKEAGVGIGKSFAYLIPIVNYIKENKNAKVIISTSTIALQEQLIIDIKKIKELTGIDIPHILIKGMGNYACLRRINNNKHLKKEVHPTQDRKYNQDFTDKEWKQVCVENCDHNNCRERYNCKYYEIKQAINNSNENIIICNHNMLIEYLNRSTPNSINQSNIIICDEAHNLENIIKDYYTESLNFNELFRLLYKSIDDDGILNKIKQNLKNELYTQVIKQINYYGNQGTSSDELQELAIEFNDNLYTIFNNLSTYLIDAISEVEYQLYNIDLGYHKNKGLEKQLENLLDQLENIKRTIKNMLNNDNIIWFEKIKDNYIIKFINKRIFNSNKLLLNNYKGKSVFTSATITSENDYTNFIDSIGLSGYDISVGDIENSPYDYDNNTLLYIPKDVPNPKDKDKYLESITNYIVELIKMTNGKSLVLFTSKNDMKYVYDKVKQILDRDDIYIQKDGSSQEEIKEKFKNNINSILFSTGTFWEGIDIKGESLSNLIIAKLPFPVVSPYLEYKKEINEPNGFKKVYVSNMLIKLKQGCGRLIRSEDDKGIITILDSRAYKYIDSIINSINTKNYTDDIFELQEFVNNNINDHARIRKR